MKSRLIAQLIGIVMVFCGASAVAPAAELTAQWTQQRTLDYFPNGPGPRVWVNLTFNPQSGRLLLFGGGGSQFRWDIWEYETRADAWTPIELPANNCPGFYGFGGPDGRDAHSVQYDPYNNLVWSVAGGGYKCANNTDIANTDTHTVTSAPDTSTLIDTTLPTGVTVDFYKDWAIVANNALAYVRSYDPARQTLRLATPIAGLAAGTKYELRVWTNSGTWYYSPVTRQWRSLDGPHWGYTGPNPNRLWGRDTAGFAYSSANRAMVMFGGSVNGSGTNETWMLDLTDRSQPGHPAVWALKNANSYTSTLVPPKRNEITSAMVYDSRNDVFVLFGGRCQDTRCPNVAAGDTWVYKLSTNTWTQKNPPVSPAGRLSHQMYYDSENGVVVLFGGTNVDFYSNSIPQSGFFTDLWVYDYAANTWTQLTSPALRPGGRIFGSLAYDPLAKAGVLYGGATYPYSGAFDVWKLTLTKTGSSGNQAPIAVAQVAPASGTTITTFSASSAGSRDPDGTVVSYLWNFGDGSLVSGQTAWHQYSAPGTYTITLTVTDNYGATASATAAVTVLASVPAPQINLKSVTIGGSVSDLSIAAITVNGVSVPVSGGAFQAAVPLAGTSTTVTIRATGAGGTTTRTLTISAP